jgi:hypothetical protein
MNTDGEGEHRVRDIGRWSVDDRICLEQGRLHLEGFKTP